MCVVAAALPLLPCDLRASVTDKPCKPQGPNSIHSLSLSLFFKLTPRNEAQARGYGTIRLVCKSTATLNPQARNFLLNIPLSFPSSLQASRRHMLRRTEEELCIPGSWHLQVGCTVVSFLKRFGNSSGTRDSEWLMTAAAQILHR